MMAFKKYIWKCPHKGCEACARQPLTYGKAGRHGRYHLKKIHNDFNSEPIVKEYNGGEELGEYFNKNKARKNRA